MNSYKKLHPQTLAIRGAKQQTAYNEHHQALFLTSSFMFDSAADGAALFSREKQGFTYSRTGNPTVATFQTRIAQLEGAQAGIATATGMAAIHAALFTFLNAGDHLITSRSLFGTTAGLILGHLTRFGVEVTQVPQTQPDEWRQAMRPNTKMLFLETPTNPLGEVGDLVTLASIAHEHGALLAVDNCFCSSAMQQPLQFGADLSIQSATKSIDGQGRVLGGIVCGKQDLIEQVATYVNAAGLSLSPFNAWILLSGVETLLLRTEQQGASALRIAQWLQAQDVVARVHYSGLPEHPQADLVKKQQHSGGTVLAFEVKGGFQAAWKVMDGVQVFSKTANFGDVRSTITHPWTSTHCRLSPEDKLAVGISEGLLRLSIGLEYIDDLIEDLRQALALTK